MIYIDFVLLDIAGLFNNVYVFRFHLIVQNL